jgi:hypothetical protein
MDRRAVAGGADGKSAGEKTASKKSAGMADVA